MTTPQPFDGTAVILHLIEAARAWRAGDPAPFPEEQNLTHWVDELERRWARELGSAEPVGWEPRRWRELEPGDTVSLKGVEAVVKSAITLGWHVHPDKYRYVEGRGRVYEPLEHAITELRLEGRETAYKMPPDGEVECLRGELGQERDRAAGRGREQHETERAAVLEHWATEAAQTLEAAGLGPIEALR